MSDRSVDRHEASCNSTIRRSPPRTSVAGEPVDRRRPTVIGVSPGVSFTGDVGVLCRADLRNAPGR
jgi:hypothetical protein